MARAITTAEPIPIPDLRRPTVTPWLPVWLTTLQGALRVALQETPEGFKDIPTVPQALTTAQHRQVEQHVLSLESAMTQTPQNDTRFEADLITELGEMMLVLSDHKATALSTETKIAAYVEALEDLPVWAVIAARRRWYRGQCGLDENKRAYEYKWMPDPATLRRVALWQLQAVKTQVDSLKQVLSAVTYVNCDAALEKGMAAMAGLSIARKTGVDLGTLTFEDAAALGVETKPTP